MNYVLQKHKKMGIVLVLSLILGITLNILPTKANMFLFLGLILLPTILWRYEIGIYIAVMAMPAITFKYIALLIFYTFTCFLIRHIYYQKTLKTTEIDGPILLFFIILLVSSFTSITFKQSLKELFLYTSIIFLVIMVAKGLNRKQINYLLILFIISATLVSMLGIYQYFTGEIGHRAWVDVKSNPDLEARAFSIMGNPNILAEYLVIVCSLAIALFLDSKNIYRKILMGIVASINILCLVLTFSRGGWIGFAIALFTILIFEEKRIVPIGILLGIVSLFFLPDVVIDRIKSIANLKDTSNAYRFLIWSAALKMLKDFWISGVGLGYAAFIKAYPNYTLGGIKAAHAHNVYLQIAIETGLLGLIIFFYNILKTYVMGVLTILQSKDSFYKRISVASMGAVSGLLFHGLVEHVLFDYRIVFSFWLIVGLIAASYKRKENDLQVI
jgi:O-antigen ligase